MIAASRHNAVPPKLARAALANSPRTVCDHAVVIPHVGHRVWHRRSSKHGFRPSCSWVANPDGLGTRQRATINNPASSRPKAISPTRIAGGSAALPCSPLFACGFLTSGERVASITKRGKASYLNGDNRNVMCILPDRSEPPSTHATLAPTLDLHRRKVAGSRSLGPFAPRYRRYCHSVARRRSPRQTPSASRSASWP